MSDNIYSDRTLKNFDNFNNMFKGIDDPAHTPHDIAWCVLEKINRNGCEEEIEDADLWHKEGYFLKVRDWVDEELHLALDLN